MHADFLININNHKLHRLYNCVGILYYMRLFINVIVMQGSSMYTLYHCFIVKFYCVNIIIIMTV